MLQCSTPAVSREWFRRAQSLPMIVANDAYGLLAAMSPGNLRRLLQCAANSTQKLLQCDEEESKRNGRHG